MNNVRNSVQLIGHLGGDPETKTLETGTTVTKLRVATSENYKAANGQWKEETQWHNVVAWEGIAERAAKQLYKGSFVLIHGKLVTRGYTDAQGQKKWITEVRATGFLLLDKTKTGTEAHAMAATHLSEDLPF